MAETKNKNKPIPSLAGYGGVRTLQKNLEKSTTLAANREAVVMSCACLRDHLGGLVSPVGRTVKREGNVPTQYDHGEGSEGLESHVRRSERFFFPILPTALADLAPWSRLPAEWSDDVRHGRALHGSVQGVHGVAGRDGTVSGRCILVLRRLHIQSPRKWSTSADFRELAWTAVCECASRRYIHGQTDGRFIGHVNFQRL